MMVQDQDQEQQTQEQTKLMTLKEFLNWVGEYWGVFLIFLIFVYWTICLTYDFILCLINKGKDFCENGENDDDYED